MPPTLHQWGSQAGGRGHLGRCSARCLPFRQESKVGTEAGCKGSCSWRRQRQSGCTIERVQPKGFVGRNHCRIYIKYWNHVQLSAMIATSNNTHSVSKTF